MTTPAVLRDLEGALRDDDLVVVLSAAWDVFDVAGRAADAVTWEPGSDELQALLASQACFAGRRLLPLPETRRSAELQAPPDTQGPLTPYVELLERTRATLSGLAEGDGAGSEARSALLEAAAHARTGAVCLAGVRETP